MNFNERIKYFTNEIEQIQSEEIKNYILKAIEILPDYFFDIPASAGKYHPSYALRPHGLVYYTKAAVAFALELLRLSEYSKFTGLDRDIIIVSLILHDGWKAGTNGSDYTVETHPVIAVEMLKNSKELRNIIPAEQEKLILNNILTHMGQWRLTRFTRKKFAPLPKTKMQKLVHLADYTVSRKMFEVFFNER